MTSQLRRYGFLTAVLIAVALPGVASAGVIEHAVAFREQDIQTSRRNGYDVVTLAACDLTREVGSPQLPVRAVTIALPPGASFVTLEITSAESRERLQRVTPWPAQRPRILPIPGIDLPSWRFARPNQTIYGGHAAYPAAVAEVSSITRVGASQTVGVSVYPLQFLPDTGRLRFFSRVVLRLRYEDGPAAPGLAAKHESGRFARAVLTDVSGLGPARASLDLEETLLDPDDIEYVIIADDAHAAAFAPLADWKSQKGVPATIVTVQWIDATYAGDDTQERIRAFIADAYETWGSVWILLGGDTDWVPARHAYAMTCEAGGHALDDDLAADLYYADLDGDWNLDGDDTYGETDDDVDLYPEVFVGRAPVTSVEEAEVFVGKVLDYERASASGVELDMLMAAEILWDDPFTDSGIALNRIDRDSVPPRFDPITKLYETLGNESVTSVVEAINAGKGHFLHSGHAWYTVMGCGEGYMNRSHADALTNAMGLPVVYSIGCWPAAFDLEESCIAEHFLRNPGGGAVAFIGNDRYGWASPGNPGFGYSERFMQEFYRFLFVEEVRHAGAVLAAAKAVLIPFSQSENVYRWHQYELNLLGDPEMPIWTREPALLSVEHPHSVVAGTFIFDATVRTSTGPVADALVCLRNGVDLYGRGHTGSDGTVTMAVETAVPETLELTVTAADCRPYETTVPVAMSGVYLRGEGLAIDDASGNGDGLAGPGETVDLSLTVRNFGTEEATGVDVTITTDDPWAQVLAGESAYPDIPGGETAVGEPAFSISIVEGCADGHVVDLDVDIVSAGGRGSWGGTIALTVAAAVLSTGGYDVDDAWGGNGNGVPEPGEILKLMVEVTNGGLADASAAEATLASLDPDVFVTGGSASLGRIPSGGLAQAVFEIQLAHGIPVPHFPELSFATETAEGETSSDTLVIAVGDVGRAYDFEDGAAGWNHGGESDLWTLTSHRAHSGATSWYCGSTDTWEYADDMNCHLDSPEFTAGPNMELSFWCWYEFPIYHEDGFFVELLSGSDPVDTLDFIGSGGALDMLGSIGNDWLEYRYLVPDMNGDALKVRFRFTSDGADVEEGVYIDDVAVGTAVAPSGTGVAGGEEEVGEMALLHQNCPNPFSPSTSITFSMRGEAEASLAIYNVQGRLIRTLVRGPVRAGEHSVTWEGTDELGVDVAAGVYLYRLTVGEHEETRKMILVR